MSANLGYPYGSSPPHPHVVCDTEFNYKSRFPPVELVLINKSSMDVLIYGGAQVLRKAQQT
jgi:hypothetical protein